MSKREIIAAIGVALADLQAAYDDRDRALAQRLGIGRTDLRCLDLIIRGGPQSASRLGEQLNLTRGSMTTLVDRLERVGYVRRRADPHHGKKKLIVPTLGLVATVRPLVEARSATGARALDRLGAVELSIILDFLRSTVTLQSPG